MQYYGNEGAWSLNVGVQLFLVIGGFLYGARDITSPIGFYKRQLKKILIPYYLFLIPVTVLYFAFVPERISLYSAVAVFLCAGTPDRLEHLWFVGYILFCYLITPLLCELKKYIRNYSAFKKAGLCFCCFKQPEFCLTAILHPTGYPAL